MFRPAKSETVELPLLMLLKGDQNTPAHTLVRQVHKCANMKYKGHLHNAM